MKLAGSENVRYIKVSVNEGKIVLYLIESLFIESPAPCARDSMKRVLNKEAWNRVTLLCVCEDVWLWEWRFVEIVLD